MPWPNGTRRPDAPRSSSAADPPARLPRDRAIARRDPPATAAPRPDAEPTGTRCSASRRSFPVRKAPIRRLGRPRRHPRVPSPRLTRDPSRGYSFLERARTMARDPWRRTRRPCSTRRAQVISGRARRRQTQRPLRSPISSRSRHATRATIRGERRSGLRRGVRAERIGDPSAQPNDDLMRMSGATL